MASYFYGVTILYLLVSIALLVFVSICPIVQILVQDFLMILPIPVPLFSIHRQYCLGELHPIMIHTNRPTDIYTERKKQAGLSRATLEISSRISLNDSLGGLESFCWDELLKKVTFLLKSPHFIIYENKPMEE